MPETSPDLSALHAHLAEDGWTDAELMTFIVAAHEAGELDRHVSAVYAAVLDPAFTEEDPGARFFEALAWYVDSTAGDRDGRLTTIELAGSLQQHARKYLGLVGDPAAASARLQAWKMVQKLRMLQLRLEASGADAHPYRPMAMRTIDPTDPWNAANTIDSAAEFQARVIEASHDRPVLVKFGLPYCTHCLLLEQLGSVPAVATRYSGSIHVRKLWWNPNDPAMAEITAVARSQGVTSSPWFIVYVDGAAVRSAYAFPDETGAGVEPLLEGIIPA